MRVPSGGCHLLSVDDQAFHACWIRRHDTGRSNILPKKQKSACYITSRLQIKMYGPFDIGSIRGLLIEVLLIQTRNRFNINKTHKGFGDATLPVKVSEGSKYQPIASDWHQISWVYLFDHSNHFLCPLQIYFQYTVLVTLNEIQRAIPLNRLFFQGIESVNVLR